jgi:hypothetical protein
MPDDAMAYNESHVCDVALSPTRAKGHVAERRAAAPRSPSRPAGAAMYIRAVMCRCARFLINYRGRSIYLGDLTMTLLLSTVRIVYKNHLCNESIE